MLYLAWKVWKGPDDLSANVEKAVGFLSGMILPSLCRFFCMGIIWIRFLQNSFQACKSCKSGYGSFAGVLCRCSVPLTIMMIFCQFKSTASKNNKKFNKRISRPLENTRVNSDKEVNEAYHQR